MAQEVQVDVPKEPSIAASFSSPKVPEAQKDNIVPGGFNTVPENLFMSFGELKADIKHLSKQHKEFKEALKTLKKEEITPFKEQIENRLKKLEDNAIQKEEFKTHTENLDKRLSTVEEESQRQKYCHEIITKICKVAKWFLLAVIVGVPCWMISNWDEVKSFGSFIYSLFK